MGRGIVGHERMLFDFESETQLTCDAISNYRGARRVWFYLCQIGGFLRVNSLS